MYKQHKRQNTANSQFITKKNKLKSVAMQKKTILKNQRIVCSVKSLEILKIITCLHFCIVLISATGFAFRLPSQLPVSCCKTRCFLHSSVVDSSILVFSVLSEDECLCQLEKASKKLIKIQGHFLSLTRFVCYLIVFTNDHLVHDLSYSKYLMMAY